MPELLPPNLEDAYRSELAGLEQRLKRVGVGDVVSGQEILLREALEARVAALRANLGEAPAAPVRGRRKANGAETRPGDNGVETA